MKKINFRLFFLRTFDYLIIPLSIFFFSFDPLFAQGHIVPFDDGQHLGWINSLWHGKIPYRDVFMLYGFLLEYLPVLLMKIFGESIVVVRAFYHFGMIIGLLLSYFLSRMVLKTRFFIYISALLIVMTKIGMFWSARWGGPRVTMAIAVLIFLALYVRYGKRILLYLAGLMSAVTFFTSQEIGLCIFFASFVFIIACNKTEEKLWSKNVGSLILVYSLGVLTVALLIMLYFIFKGALGSYFTVSFFDIFFRFPKSFTDPHPIILLLTRGGFSNFEKSVLFSRTILFFISTFIYIMGTGVLLHRLFKKRFKKDDLLALLLVSFGGMLFIFTQRAIWGMQFNMAAPPIIILGCLLLERFLVNEKLSLVQSLQAIFMPPQRTAHVARNSPCPCGSGKKYKNCCVQKASAKYKENIIWIGKVFTMIGSLGLFFNLVAANSYWKPKISFKDWLKNYGKISGASLTHGFDSYNTAEEHRAKQVTGWASLSLKRAEGIYVPKDQQEIVEGVARYLQSRLSEDESIFTFPHDGHYYFLLDRIGPSRFDSLIYATISNDYQNEVIKALERDKTRYIIYVKDAYVFTDFHKIANEVRLNLIFDYIKNNYVEKVKFGETYILMRKP